MRRRKARLVVLGLFLLICVVFSLTWLWSERPPYRFMEGGSVWFVELSGREARISYVSLEPYEDLAAKAQAEVPGEWGIWYFEKRSNAYKPNGIFLESADIGISRLDAEMRKALHGAFPRVPDESATLITVSQRASLLDRFRAWLFRLRWRGNRP